MGRTPGVETEAKQHQQTQKKPPSASTDVELKLGWDHANRQSVALKTFRTDPSNFQDHRCNQLHVVEHEVKSMMRITPHNNIVGLVDFVARSPSNVCLVMEAAAASRRNLMETIAAAPEGRLRRDAARFYLGQLLDAVQHCHSKGVCHRDIKPRHLLVDTRSGNLKLSDFGQAGLWDTEAGDSTDLTYVSSAALSAHAAPEVLKGSKYCGKAVDCWSVGVTLFTMLAGFFPFKDDEAEMRNYDRYLQPILGVCQLARSLLDGMMEPNPEERYTVAQVRSHQWFVLKRGSNRPNHGSSSTYSSSGESEGDNNIPRKSSGDGCF